MNLSTKVVIATCMLASTGCTSRQVYQGLYEGLKTRNELQSSPAERVGQPAAPGYGQYEQLRTERATPATDSTASK